MEEARLAYLPFPLLLFDSFWDVGGENTEGVMDKTELEASPTSAGTLEFH